MERENRKTDRELGFPPTDEARSRVGRWIQAKATDEAIAESQIWVTSIIDHCSKLPKGAGVTIATIDGVSMTLNDGDLAGLTRCVGASSLVDGRLVDGRLVDGRSVDGRLAEGPLVDDRWRIKGPV